MTLAAGFLRRKPDSVSLPVDERLRVGDLIAPRGDPTRQYRVEAIYSVDRRVDARRHSAVHTFSLDGIERGITEGSILIVEDGPSDDPRWTTLKKTDEQL